MIFDSIGEDGEIYNNGKGYEKGMLLDAIMAGCTTTGYIPYQLN
jgi:hypothetical protein